MRALSLSTSSKSALNLLSPVVDKEPHLRKQASEAQVAGLLGGAVFPVLSFLWSGTDVSRRRRLPGQRYRRETLEPWCP
jgi:hypothetical protein